MRKENINHLPPPWKIYNIYIYIKYFVLTCTDALIQFSWCWVFNTRECVSSDLIGCAAASTWPKSDRKWGTTSSFISIPTTLRSLTEVTETFRITGYFQAWPDLINFINNFTISVRTRHLSTVVTVTFPQLSPSILWISPPAESVQISIKMLFFREKFKPLKRINNHTLKKNKRKSIGKLELFFVKRKFPFW